MFDLSDRLLLIVGNLEPFTKTGGTVTAQEMQWLTAQLQACADAARELKFNAAWAERQLNELVEDAAEQARLQAPQRVLPRRRLRVIEGGRA
jgi:hypothetical protein